jgi:hypothetical protein
MTDERNWAFGVMRIRRIKISAIRKPVLVPVIPYELTWD